MKMSSDLEVFFCFIGLFSALDVFSALDIFSALDVFAVLEVCAGPIAELSSPRKQKL